MLIFSLYLSQGATQEEFQQRTCCQAWMLTVPQHPHLSRSSASLDTVSCSILLCLSSRVSCSDCNVWSSDTLICKLFWESCNLIFSWSISISRCSLQQKQSFERNKPYFVVSDKFYFIHLIFQCHTLAITVDIPKEM